MNIGIDIDDTISDTYATLFEYAQKYTVEELKREPIINKCDSTNHFYIVYMHNWSEEEALKFWDKYYAEILKKVSIKTFASDYIRKLRKKGHKVFLITARWEMENDNVREITIQWLKENNVEYDEFFMNADDKLQLVKDNKIDVFIDDSFDNCKKIAYNSKAKAFLMDSRMNRSLQDDKIKRVYSWSHVYNLIENMEGEI